MCKRIQDNFGPYSEKIQLIFIPFLLFVVLLRIIFFEKILMKLFYFVCKTRAIFIYMQAYLNLRCVCKHFQRTYNKINFLFKELR